MKKYWLWILLAAGGLYLWTRRKPAASPVVAQTTGTQAAQAPWFPGFNGFTQANLDSTTKSVNGAFAALKSLANNFGWNDGGTNPGVSVAGSQRGGTQSAGGGAGVPVNNNSPDINLTPMIIDDYSGGGPYVPLNQYGGGDFGGELSPDGFAA